MKKTILGFLAFFALSLPCYAAVTTSAWPSDSGVNIGTKLDAGYEPSGIIWHNRLQSLFVIWDNGYVTQMDTSGNIIHATTYVGGDLEGITVVDDQSNFIYLLVEYPQKIVEYDISKWATTGKSWTLQGMTGNSASGAEALTYNKDKGVFYVGSQYDGQIYVYDIDLNTSGSPSYSYKISTGIGFDSSGVYYLADTKRTYAIFDSSNFIQEYDSNENLVTQYNLPGNDQEGVALLPNCSTNKATIFIAQDSGAVMKYNGYPIVCVATPPTDKDGDGYSAENDCNDNDPTIHANQTYYLDKDKDGLGDPKVTTSICSLTVPAGYVSNANDVNDNDRDNDGSEIGADCNDNDPAIHSNQTYYFDNDKDGLGNPNNSISVCSLTPPTGYVKNSSDSNDKDYDNDGVETGTDCDDKNPSILGPQTYYYDADKDGLGNPAKSTSACSIPASYVSNNKDLNDNDHDNDGSEIGIDCNDNDPAIYANQTYYRDNDKDGLGDPKNSTSICSMTVPTGYVSNSKDLNDNDYDNDGVAIGTDCNDSDPAILGPQTYYLDADKDGLGNPAKSTSACSIPASYVSNNKDLNDNDHDNDGSEIGIDCNDNDPAIYANQTYYRDNDKDGLGDPNNTVSVCSLTSPAGYVSNANDDNDNPTPTLTVKLDGSYIYVNGQKIKVFFIKPSKSTYEIIDLDKDGLNEIVVVGLYLKKYFMSNILQVGNDGKAYVITSKKLGYTKYNALWNAAAPTIAKLKNQLLGL
jgi:hypothetical protein